MVTPSMRSMNVRCRRPSDPPEGPYGVGVIAANLNPWFIGNLLIGGFIGMIIDLASGAAGTYPASVAVAMPAPPPVVIEPPAEPQPTGRRGRPIS